MSYRAGMGIAIPSLRSKQTSRRGVKWRGLRGLGAVSAEKQYWDAMAQACTQMANEGTCLSRVARHVPVTVESAFAGMGGMNAMQRRHYWQGMANACRQYADEGACLARISRRTPVTITSAFSGLGALFAAAPGGPLGQDAHRRASGSTVSVGAHWAKRAVNALNAYDGSHTRIHVNGPVGPATMAALRAAARRILPPTATASDLAVASDPPGHRTTQRVMISAALETALARLTQVADPPRPASATRRTTSTALVTAATDTPTVTPSSGKVPGAPDAPPTDTSAVVGTAPDGSQVIIDEGDTTPDWLMPALLVGGATVAGSIGLVMWGRSRAKAPTKNSRRKRKHKRRK